MIDMKFLRSAWGFVWCATGVLVAADWCIDGLTFVGAWLGWNAPPTPSLATQAIVFIGAAIYMLEQTTRRRE